MTTLKVRYIASTLAATAGIRFKWTVPTFVFCNITYHIFLLVMPSETVLTELFSASANFVIFVAHEDKPSLLAQMTKCYLIENFYLKMRQHLLCPV